MQAFLLILHLLGACIWVGGHIYLVVCLLPSILKHKDVAALLSFEQSYEKLGMSALAVQVVTGLMMSHKMLPFSLWFSGDNDVSKLIMLKLLWLGLTIIVALHAQLRVIPKLSPQTLPLMAAHAVLIMLLSICFVLTGVGFRFGLPI